MFNDIGLAETLRRAESGTRPRHCGGESTQAEELRVTASGSLSFLSLRLVRSRFVWAGCPTFGLLRFTANQVLILQRVCYEIS